MFYQISIYSDGGARGNPGPAGIGAVIKITPPLIPPQTRGGNREWRLKKFIGRATNNQAEYLALIFSLEKVFKMKAENGLEISQIKCYLDSQLVVSQVNKKYKIKNAELAQLFLKVWKLKQKLGRVEFIYISREKNKEADKLVNQAITDALY